MRRLGVALATAGGLGFAPVAPGTWGAAVGVGLYALTCYTIWSQAATLVVVTLVGIWASGEAERHFGREDPGQVVIDEVAGQYLTLAFTGVSGWWAIALGFGLFRLFDIAKPWPVRQAEALDGGVGIMADDLLAGLYGHLCLQLLLRFVPGLT